MYIKRILLDVVLLVLFLLTVSFQFLPKILHEVLGILIPVAVVLHLIWNRPWFSSLLREKWNFRRGISAVIHWLLMINVVVIPL